MRIPIAEISADPATQSRARLKPTAVKEYAEAMRAGADR